MTAKADFIQRHDARAAALADTLVADELGITVGLLHSPRSLETIAHARFIVLHLLHGAGLSNARAGAHFGMSADSARYGLARLREMLSIDRNFAAQIDRLETRFTARLESELSHNGSARSHRPKNTRRP